MKDKMRNDVVSFLLGIVLGLTLFTFVLLIEILK